MKAIRGLYLMVLVLGVVGTLQLLGVVARQVGSGNNWSITLAALCGALSLASLSLGSFHALKSRTQFRNNYLYAALFGASCYLLVRLLLRS